MIKYIYYTHTHIHTYIYPTCNKYYIEQSLSDTCEHQIIQKLTCIWLGTSFCVSMLLVYREWNWGLVEEEGHCLII